MTVGTDVHDTENLVGAVIHAKAGSTIRLVPPAAETATAGFACARAVYPAAWPTNALTSFVVTERLPAVTAIPQATGIAEALVETVLYSALWYVPADGVYSFYENIDDTALIAIDGTVVLSDARYNTPTCVQGVALTAGWHDLVVALGNGVYGAFGVYGGDALGIGYSATNALITVTEKGDAVAFADPGDGSSLRPKVFSNGELPVCANLLLDGGEVTVDVSDHPAAVHFLGGVLARDGGSLKVKGASYVAFGGARSDDDVHYPIFDTDLVFEDVADTCVRFDGYVTVARPQTNWRALPKASVALFGTNTLGAADLVLDGWNLTLLDPMNLPSDATLTIGARSTCCVKPCERNPNAIWRTWKGKAAVVPQHFVLADATALLRVRGYKSLEFTGDITGTGDLLLDDKNSDNSPTTFRGTLDFRGTVTVRTLNTVVYSDAFGHRENPLVVTASDPTSPALLGGITFARDDDGSAPRDVWVDSVNGQALPSYLRVGSNTTLHVGRASGTLSFSGNSPTNSFVEIGFLGTNATVRTFAYARMTVLTNSPDAHVICEKSTGGDDWDKYWCHVTLLDTACPLSHLTVTNGWSVAEVSGEIGYADGDGTIRVADALNVYSVTNTLAFAVAAGGRLEFGNAAARATALGANPALWLDASDAATLQQYTVGTGGYACTFTNGVVIRRWNDCRPEQTTLFGLNPRGSGYTRVLPVTETNACNGRTVVSFGAYKGTVLNKYGYVDEDGNAKEDSYGDSQPETRRLPLNAVVNPQWAIMVFGSSFGGGLSLLGGYKTSGEGRDLRASDESPWVDGTTDGVFTRPGYVSNPSGITAASPILSLKTDLWIDGVLKNAATTGYSGGYQILSLDTKGLPVRSLGMVDSYGNAGGQIYGELILFTNRLARVERMAVEAYLAGKWQVPGYPFAARQITVAEGGTVALNGVRTALYGKGSVTACTDLVVSGGAFAGTLNLAEGRRLEIAGLPVPTADDLPSAGRAGWFDPEDGEDLMLGTPSVKTTNYEHSVDALFSHGQKHVPGSPYLYGAFVDNGNEGDRRPRIVRSARGDGPVRNWMDYREEIDGGGNNLRVKTDHAHLDGQGVSVNYEAVPLNIRTGFIVMDSSYGGGMPVLDAVSPGTLVKYRGGTSYANPIWAKGTTPALTNGCAYLNGLACNPNTDGFTGAPEVFTFTATEDFPLRFVGFYNSAGANRNSEILGEMLFYDRVVTETERTDVEAYLMNKWLGTVSPKYLDPSRLTVSGAGTVSVPARHFLPRFADGFAGVVELAGGLSFVVDSAAETKVPGALTLPGTLAVPATGSVTVTFASAAQPGVYRLVTAAMAGNGFADWSVCTPEGVQAGLIADANGLALRIVARGTVILMR